MYKPIIQKNQNLKSKAIRELQNYKSASKMNFKNLSTYNFIIIL